MSAVNPKTCVWQGFECEWPWGKCDMITLTNSMHHGSVAGIALVGNPLSNSGSSGWLPGIRAPVHLIFVSVQQLNRKHRKKISVDSTVKALSANALKPVDGRVSADAVDMDSVR